MFSPNSCLALAREFNVTGWWRARSVTCRTNRKYRAVAALIYPVASLPNTFSGLFTGWIPEINRKNSGMASCDFTQFGNPKNLYKSFFPGSRSCLRRCSDLFLTSLKTKLIKLTDKQTDRARQPTLCWETDGPVSWRDNFPLNGSCLRFVHGGVNL